MGVLIHLAKEKILSASPEEAGTIIILASREESYDHAIFSCQRPYFMYSLFKFFILGINSEINDC